MVRLAADRSVMRTGAAVLLVGVLFVAGCTSESGTGPTHPGTTPADEPGGTAAPITLTPTPGIPSRSTPAVRTPAARTPARSTAVRKSVPVLRSEPSAGSSLQSPMVGRGRPAPMRKSTPVRVIIPAIGVDSSLMRLGIKSNGSLQVPPNGFPAGWFTGGPRPGEQGPAVIAGHVRWAGRSGVFARLGGLRPGDTVTVNRQDGSRAVFRVNRVKQYPKSSFPSAAVYGNLNHAGLRLITCGGFDTVSAKYEANVVVFADLVNG